MPSLRDIIAESDGLVEGLSFEDENLAGAWLGRVEFDDCSFVRCSFSEAEGERLCFDRCTLRDCDLSNARLPKAFLRDCRLTTCRATGLDLYDGYLRACTWRDSALDYANFDGCKMERVAFVSTRLVEAAFTRVRLKGGLTLKECDLTRAELSGTNLRGVDLSECTLAGLRLTQGLPELHGARIAPWQAPELVALLGVLVED